MSPQYSLIERVDGRCDGRVAFWRELAGDEIEQWPLCAQQAAGHLSGPGAAELCATWPVTQQLITLAFKNFDRQLKLMGDTPHQRIVRDCQLRKALSVIGNQLVQCID